MSVRGMTGRCLCGEVRYRIEGDLIWSGYCHCDSCRRFTGAVVTNWLGIRDSDLIFTSGQPAIYRVDGVSRGFCRYCGSSITYAATHFPEYIQLHIGSLDDASAVEPMAHVHCAEKPGWFEIDDSLPRFAGSAAADGDWKL